MRNGFHFSKEQPAESHVLLQIYDDAETGSVIFDNKAVIPAQGAFTALLAEPSNAVRGYFDEAPGGQVAYCTDKGNYIWGGDEMRCAGFINFDPNGSFFQDYTPKINNTLTDAANIASLKSIASGITNAKFLLDFDGKLITGITRANPAVVTSVAHGFVNGQTVAIYEVGGMTQVNGVFIVANKTDNTFELSGIDSTGYSTYTSGGFAGFKDAGSINGVITVNGDAQPDTSQFKFARAGKFDGTGDYLTTPDHASFDMSGGTFTVDGWIRVDSVAAQRTIYYQRTSGTEYFSLHVTTSLEIQLVITLAGTTVSFKTPANAISLNTWHHIAVVELTDDWYIFVDGKMRAHITDTDRATNYTGVVHIGSGNAGATPFSGWIDELRVFNTVAVWTADFLPPLSAHISGTKTLFYVGSTRPLKGFKLYMGTVQPATATHVMNVFYWNGSAWTAVGSLVDGTKTEDTSLNKTGSVTFTDTDGLAKLKNINNQVLFWYIVEIVPGVDVGTTITYCTVDAAFQKMKDIWSGEYAPVATFLSFEDKTYKDFTLNVFKDEYDPNISSSFAELKTFWKATGEFLIAGFFQRMRGIKVGVVQSKHNSASQFMTVSYWDGTAWVALTNIDDGTLQNAATLGKTGTVLWDPPAAISEFPNASLSNPVNESVVRITETRYFQYLERVTISKDIKASFGASLFFYKIEFSGALSTDLQVYHIAGIPAEKTIEGYRFPVFDGDAVFLCSEHIGEKNKAIKCVRNAPDVWNGGDYEEFYFGNEAALTTGVSLYFQVGSNVYRIRLFFKDSETWILLGSGPDDRQGPFLISDSIGCPAPQTMKTLDYPVDLQTEMGRRLAIWQGSNGVYLCNGRSIIPIHHDIRDIFEQGKINPSKIGDSVGFVDRLRFEYHWLFASTNSTTLDKEWVFDLIRQRWFEIDRGGGKRLQLGIAVKDTNGNPYTYGCIDTGFMERLENGNDFDGAAILATLELGDLMLGDDPFFETLIRQILLIGVAKTVTANAISGTHYGDGATAGDSFSMTPTKAGYRIFDALIDQVWNPARTHGLKFQMTTNDEAVGFEPLHLLVAFKEATSNI